MTSKQTVCFGVLAALAAMFVGRATVLAAPDETAARLVESSGAAGGICVVVGPADAELAMAVARQGNFVVHCLTSDVQRRDALRQSIRAAGMYGKVSVGLLDDGRLPYVDNLVNVVIVDPYPAPAVQGPSTQELLRVLAPLGVAFLRGGKGIEGATPVEADSSWLRLQKPWPSDIDQWTHYLHGPDGNPVAQDRVVGPPKHYQWVGGPLFMRSHETDSSISTLVTADGRLFAIVDEAPISMAGQHPLPDKWSLVARDAFNGVPLWKVPIRRWGWREWKSTWFNTRPGDIPLNIQKRLVARGDKVYVTLGYQAPVSELDALTGEILQTYAGTERTGEILLTGGTLVLAMLDGDRVRVAAVDATSGKQLWLSEKSYAGTTVDYIRWKEMNGGGEPEKLDPSVNMATDGSVVALIDGPEIVALDFRTGKEKWRSAFPLAEGDRTAGGMQSRGNLWIGTMIVRDGVVLHASPSQLAGLSAATGEVLWSQPKQYIGHLWYEWKDVFVIGPLVWTWSAEMDSATLAPQGARKQHSRWPVAANGYDLHTGALVKSVPLANVFTANHHHRCYRNKATERYIIASRRGSEYIDLVDGHHTVDNWVRGTCHVGMMPANGLQYAPPHPCACYIEEKLNGMNALAPARPEDDLPQEDEGASPAERLTRGPAFGDAAGPAATDADWPTFRHDALRTGSVATRVPDDAQRLWRVVAGSRVSAPTVVSDRVFVALVDEHQVACLSAIDGSKRWEFAAGARVDSPPTYYQGTVLFGSTDGWVYCLRATDGQLAWRFRAAPQQRLMGAFGQLESVWPVHGSVLVQDGTVYIAAGRSSHLDGGITLWALDAATGRAKYRRKLQGPAYDVENVEVNYQLPMGYLPDILVGDGSKVYMRSTAFDAELKPQRGTTEMKASSTFLDDSYFKRMPWKFGTDYGRLIARDQQSVYYVRMFDSLRGLDPTVFFTPGQNGYLLFGKNLSGKRSAWSMRVPVRIRAIVLSEDRLLAAGPPDVIDPKDPLGAVEGRLGGLLYVIDAASGEKLAEHKIPSPPVFNGAAAAGGRLFLCEEDGTVSCYGKP